MRQRLLNCDFVCNFPQRLTNKAKLLYFMFFANADDKGFVGNANFIISVLNDNENLSGELLGESYDEALYELVNNGYFLDFSDNYGNHIYLITHWYFHNKYYEKGWTNYRRFLKKVKVVDGQYVLKTKEEMEKDHSHDNTEIHKSREKILEELDANGNEDDDLPFEK